MTRYIYIKQKLFDKITRYLTEEPRSEKECLPEDETITFTATFDDGYEVDVKCCGVQYNENDSNLAWAEAVLFHNGAEVCCSEPCDEIDGVWTLEDGDKVFEVVVVVE